MVSRTNALLIGAAVLLLGVGGFSLLGNKKGGDLLQNVFRTGDPPPAALPPNPNAAEITSLRELLTVAQQRFRTTFPPPRIAANRCNHPSCKRGPNLLGSLAARGTVIGIDPFTGGQGQVGFTKRFNFSKISDFTFQSILNNARRFQEGNIIKGELSAFITGIKERIGILEGTNIVTL